MCETSPAPRCPRSAADETREWGGHGRENVRNSRTVIATGAWEAQGWAAQTPPHEGWLGPDLEFDALSAELNVFDLEVDADRGNESRGKGIIGVPQKQTSFAHSCRKQTHKEGATMNRRRSNG